jgi:hypothetical protein
MNNTVELIINLKYNIRKWLVLYNNVSTLNIYEQILKNYDILLDIILFLIEII